MPYTVASQVSKRFITMQKDRKHSPDSLCIWKTTGLYHIKIYCQKPKGEISNLTQILPDISCVRQKCQLTIHEFWKKIRLFCF